MKIAVTSSNGINIDTHFGNSDRFYIYTIADNCLVFNEIRYVQKYCPDAGPDHKFNEERLKMIYKVISDCDTLYTVNIGEAPSKKLKEYGLNIQCFKGRINKMSNSINNKSYEETGIPHPGM